MDKIAEMFGGNLYIALLLLVVLLLVSVTLNIYIILRCGGPNGIWRSRGIKKAWKEVADSLTEELNRGSAKIARTLIEIAIINADTPSGRKIGNIEKEVTIYESEPDFYTRVPVIIEGINDNNHEVSVNGTYAIIRDTIDGAIELIDKFSQARELKDVFISAFSVGGEKIKDETDQSNIMNYINLERVIIEAHEAKKAIAQAVENLNEILYSLKSRQVLAVKE